MNQQWQWLDKCRWLHLGCVRESLPLLDLLEAVTAVDAQEDGTEDQHDAQDARYSDGMGVDEAGQKDCQPLQTKRKRCAASYFKQYQTNNPINDDPNKAPHTYTNILYTLSIPPASTKWKRTALQTTGTKLHTRNFGITQLNIIIHP